MNRRDAVLALMALGTAPLISEAQQAGKIPRLCYIGIDADTARFSGFFDGLRNHGYRDGQNITIDYLSAESRGERYPALAAECVRRNADIIAVSTTPAAQAAKKATSTIPIIMIALGDPVGAGLVESLARPGGNVTGMSFMAPVLAAKRLEILKEAVPGTSRVLVLTYPADPISAPQIEKLKEAARSLGVSLLIHTIRTAEDIPVAFDAGVKERATGLLLTAEGIFQVNRTSIVALAARHRLPAVYTQQPYAVEGGLIAYSSDLPALHAGAALYVDRILKGAKPADLPVMQPTKFDMTINLKTAKTLGIKIPQSVLLRADRVIE